MKFFAALIIAALSFTAMEASAKGGGGAEARAKLKAELAEARKSKGESTKSDDSGGGFFSRLFDRDDEDQAESAAKAVKPAN